MAVAIPKVAWSSIGDDAIIQWIGSCGVCVDGDWTDGEGHSGADGSLKSFINGHHGGRFQKCHTLVCQKPTSRCPTHRADDAKKAKQRRQLVKAHRQDQQRITEKMRSETTSVNLISKLKAEADGMKDGGLMMFTKDVKEMGMKLREREMEDEKKAMWAAKSVFGRWWWGSYSTWEQGMTVDEEAMIFKQFTTCFRSTATSTHRSKSSCWGAVIAERPT